MPLVAQPRAGMQTQQILKGAVSVGRDPDDVSVLSELASIAFDVTMPIELRLDALKVLVKYAAAPLRPVTG